MTLVAARATMASCLSTKRIPGASMKFYRSIGRIFTDVFRGSEAKSPETVASEPRVLDLASVPTPAYELLVMAEDCVDEVAAFLEAIQEEASRNAVRVTLLAPPAASHPRGTRVRRHVARGPRFTMADIAAALGASEAHPILLSADLLPEPNWLGALNEALKRFGAAGAVTGLVVEPDGSRVRSAGGYLDEQARVVPLQAGKTCDDADVAHVQPVMCPADIALLIRGDAWREHSPSIDGALSVRNGLSRLALLLQEKGRPVYLQPFCRLRAAADRPAIVPSSKEAWDDALQRWEVRENTPSFWRDTAHLGWTNPLQRILIVDESIPTPDRDSGSCDAFWAIKILVGLGHQVTFAAYHGDLPGHYEAQLLRWGVCVRLARDADDLRHIVASLAASAQAIFLNRVTIAREVISLINVTNERPKIIFNTVDLYHLREERFAKLQRSAALLDEAARTKRDELSIIRKADLTIVVSSYELALLQKLVPTAQTCHLPIPRRPEPSRNGFLERSGVVFIGGFLHHGNVDAVQFLVKEIWPLVRRQAPHIELQIVGSNATPEIHALQDARNGVSVLGFVEDLRPVFERVRLSVAPIRFGAGVKGKVISSLMHGVPCVTTRLAIEGTTLAADEHVLQGDTKEEIAGHIVRLHEDKDLWAKLAASGFDAASREHSVEVVAQTFVDLFKSIGLSPPRASCAPEVLAE